MRGTEPQVNKQRTTDHGPRTFRCQEMEAYDILGKCMRPMVLADRVGALWIVSAVFID
jgi:hypothetical protein